MIPAGTLVLPALRRRRHLIWQAADGCRLCRKLDSASQNVETAQHRRSSRTERFCNLGNDCRFPNMGKNGLDELREYVEKNKQYVTEFLQEKIPLIHPGCRRCYFNLMWLDCRKITREWPAVCKIYPQNQRSVCQRRQSVWQGRRRIFARECGNLQAGC